MLPPPRSPQNLQNTSFNVQGGLRILASQHVAFFAEWKFKYTRFHFDETGNTAGSNAKYNVHHLVAGIGYHF
jgi:opacity protein-like surface antigen